DGHSRAAAPAPLAGAPRAEAAPATPAKRRRNPIALAVAAGVVLALAGLGVRQWRFGRTHVSTDDAQIQGDVIPVLPKVSGFVAEVRFRENHRVRAGDTLVVLDDRDLAAKLAQAEADLAEARAAVGTAQAARDQAALQLSYTRLVAPSAGVVSRKDVEVGQLVQVGQPLMSVVPLNDVWVVANLKETEVRDVRPGDRVEIQVDSYPGHRFAAPVQ